jgi:hypothetical protein
MKLRKFINQRFILLLLLSLSFSREALAAQLQLAWVDNSVNEDGVKIDRMIGTTGAFVPIATELTTVIGSELSTALEILPPSKPAKLLKHWQLLFSRLAGQEMAAAPSPLIQ